MGKSIRKISEMDDMPWGLDPYLAKRGGEQREKRECLTTQTVKTTASTTAFGAGCSPSPMFNYFKAENLHRESDFSIIDSGSIHIYIP